MSKQSEDEKSKLIYTIKNLPPAGKRLPKGLALRLSTGNGMHVCGCSRVGVAPSIHEMRVILECLEDIYAPPFFVMDEEPARREIARLVGETAVSEMHYIWRIYWPVEKVDYAVKVLERPLQGVLL